MLSGLRIIYAILFNIFWLAPFGLFAQNLMKNGGFETATVGMPIGKMIPKYPKVLDYWTATNLDGEFIYDASKAHTGTGFLSVLQNPGTFPSTPFLGTWGGNNYDRAGQIVSVTPNTQYQIEFWFKDGDGTRYGYGDGDVEIDIEQMLPTNATIDSRIITATSSWQSTKFSFTSGSSASSIIIMFRGIGKKGGIDIWVDDVDLRVTCSADINLGNDTTLCPGKTLILSAQSSKSTYLWHDNSTNPTYTVTKPGKYWVKVTDSCGTKSDTINVSYFTLPILNLGNDTNLCQGQTLTLNASNTNCTYLWQDNSTKPSFTIKQKGIYWVKVTSNCGVISDTIGVTYNPVPFADLGNDTTLCEGDSLILNTADISSTYQWQDNSTKSMFKITQPGVYWVKITNNCGAVADTIQVNYKPLPLVTLGNDTVLCPGAELTLNVADLNSTYRWHDNSTNPVLKIDRPGKYWVRLINYCGIITDTLNVNYLSILNVDLGNDTTLCQGDMFTLNAIVTKANILWHDNSAKPSFTVNRQGKYWVTLSNICATVSDTIIIKNVECFCTVNIANSYTPNNDELNDGFAPVYDCDFSDYHFMIFNRWGEIIYETNNPTGQWDGTYRGNLVSTGVYAYMLTYSYRNEGRSVKKGTVTLIR